MLAVEAVAQLEDAALAVRERREDLHESLLAHRDLGRLVGQRNVLVGEEVAELRLLLVADRLLERDRRLRTAHDLLDLVHRQGEILRNTPRQRLAAELRAELSVASHEPF